MAVSPQSSSSVFVCHSHIDDEFCLKLVQDLRQALGNEDAVWYDASGGLKGGDNWWQRIVTELKSHSIFLVVLSPNAIASPWVNDEIDLAWKFKNSPDGKRIIPIQYQPCDIREDLNIIQMISFLPPRLYEEAFDELLNVIRQPVSASRKDSTFSSSSLPAHVRKRRRMLSWMIASFLIILAVIFGSISLLFHPSSTQNIQAGQGNTTGTNQGNTGPAKSGSQPCPSFVNSTTHWLTVLGIKNGVLGSPEDAIEGISCANLKDDASLQALILDRSLGSAGFLSVDIYDNIMSTHPTRLFQQTGLLRGDARISAANTVITSAVDADSTVNQSANDATYKEDLFQEYQWSSTQHHFIQVVFNGLFPDLTRWQADADQLTVTSGIDPWKLDAQKTTQHFAATFLKWSLNTSTALVNGGGPHDLSAVVLLDNGLPSPSGLLYQVTLNRLNNNANNGIWEVTDTSYEPKLLGVAASNTPVTTTITLPSYTSTVNPLHVSGTCASFTGKFGTIIVLDHLYNTIGHTDALQNGTSSGDGSHNYQSTVNYHSTYPGEEGIIMLSINGSGNSLAAVLMEKVILGS